MCLQMIFTQSSMSLLLLKSMSLPFLLYSLRKRIVALATASIRSLRSPTRRRVPPSLVSRLNESSYITSAHCARMFTIIPEPYHLLLFERIVFTLLHQCQFQDNDIIADVSLKAIHFVSDFARLVYCEASEEVLAEIRERGSESFAKLEQPERCRNCHDVLAIDLIRSVHYQIRKEDSAVLLILGSQLLAAISEPLLHKFNSNHNSNS